MTSTTTRVCVDCEHHVRRVGRKLPGAYAPVFHECRGSVNLVTGAVAVSQCETMRGKYGACGAKGLLFVEKSRVLEAAE